jgi:hypothetical protein
MDAVLSHAAPIALLALFVLPFWISATIGLDRLSGWSELARVYRQSKSFRGRRWWFSSGEFKHTISCRDCLTVGAEPAGLYLAIIWPFGPLAPSLFIPWTETSVTIGTRFRFFPYVEFRFHQAPDVPLRVHRRLGRRIAQAAGDGWPGPAVDTM